MLRKKQHNAKQFSVGATFIQSVSTKALNSAAVNHPYLRAICEGNLPNFDLALKDFAFQYGLYSTKFIRYVLAVTDNLSNTEHKKILLSNLAEEQGETHDIQLPPEVLASVTGQPHTNLFRRFQDAIGVNSSHRQTEQHSQIGSQWSQRFLELCKSNQYAGIGAIGLGTELIVSRIYDQILQGLITHSTLNPIERVFFDLHSQCDEKHAAQMLSIAKELAQDRTACEKIEYGATMAIEMRINFWDEMLERALALPSSSTSIDEELSAIGY